MQINIRPSDLLKQHVTDYIPNAYMGHWFYNRQRPMFTQFTIRSMLIDPRVNFGLWLIKGPMLSKAKFVVDSENEEVQEHVVDLINQFWLNGAVQALKAVEWGYSGSEVLYKEDEETKRIVYNGLKDFDSPNVKVVTKNGERTGILVDNFLTVKMRPSKAVYLGGPKAFHHVHWRHVHPYYGQSRLIGAHIPWNEIWSEGGYRDIRRLWFYKNAFQGGTMYHPRGHYKDANGNVKSFNDLAQEIVEKMTTGAVVTLPSNTNERGDRLWEYIEPRGNTIPAGLFDYGDSLRIEILEAMGIPYEVIEASGNEGFGSSSGREIPETAFYAILQEELNWLIHDFVEQVAKPNVQINAALGKLPYAKFKVLAHSLNSSPEELDYEDDMDETPVMDETEPTPTDSSGEQTNSDTTPKPEMNYDMNKRREDRRKRLLQIAY